MRVRPSRWESAIAVVAIALLTTIIPACHDVAEESATQPAPLSLELARYLTDSALIIAGLDTSGVNGILTDVRYGRILPNRPCVVIADRVDPFLRVFDGAGRLISTALPRGEGPNEARNVSGLAVSDADEILVLTGLQRTRFMEYALDGDSLRLLRAGPNPSDIPMFTVASRCGRGWAAYTTRPLRSPASIPVLAVGERDASGSVAWRNAASWDTETWNFNWGSPEAMTSDDRNVYVWHKRSLGGPILAIPCEGGSDSASVIRYTYGAPSDPAMRPVDDHGGMVLAITYPDTLHTGFAVRRGILFESETITDYRHDVSEHVFTLFSITEAGRRRSVRVPGAWEILDGRAGELLIFGEHRPTLNPITLLVPMEVVRRAVSRVWGPRDTEDAERVSRRISALNPELAFGDLSRPGPGLPLNWAVTIGGLGKLPNGPRRKARQDPPRLAATLLFDSGEHPNRAVSELGSLADAMILSDERIVLLDGRILLFINLRTGEMRTVGGEGEGPGEFAGSGLQLGLFRGPDGVAVWDPNIGNRLTTFSDSGDLLDARRIDLSGVAFRHWTANMMGVFPDGRFAFIDRDPPGASDDGHRTRQRYAVEVSEDGTWSQIAEFPVAQDGRVLFRHSTIVSFGGDRVSVADTESDEIRIFDRSGRIVSRLAMPGQRVRVSSTQLDAAKAAAQAQLGRSNENDVRQLQALGIPTGGVRPRELDYTYNEVAPPIDVTTFDADKRLWIRHYVMPGDETRRWTVWDGGDSSFSLEIPAHHGFLDARGDLVLLMVRDSLGVERVVIRRLIGA